MKILGIDYGRKKIGLALSSGKLAEPLEVIKVKLPDEALPKIKETVEKEEVQKIVVGISEGKMAEEAKAFGEMVGFDVKKPVVFEDETLSTSDAQEKAIEAGMKRKKRKEMEDAYSAALILQAYLDKS